MNSEVSFIDAGLKSISELELNPGVINLNLHCNHIDRIQNLSRLTTLRHLDLSSNKIRQIGGLSSCSYLQTLNLSCNLITEVQGLESLKQLRKLVLSYNHIKDLSGFKEVSKKTHLLKHVELHGNNLSSLKHIIDCLFHCNCITHLYLNMGEDGNPVCDIPAYRPNMFSQMPWIVCLDEKDQSGHFVDSSRSIMNDIPGLDEYLFLVEQTSPNFMNIDFSTGERPLVDEIITPRIDTILKNKSVFNQTDTSGIDEKFCNENNMNEKSVLLEDEPTSSYQSPTCNRPFVDEQRTEKKLVLEQTNSLSETSSYTKKNTSISSPDHDQEQEIALNKDKVTGEKYIKKWLAAEINSFERNNINKSDTSVSDLVKKFNGRTYDELLMFLMGEISHERESRWKAEQSSKKLSKETRIMLERLNKVKTIYEASIRSAAKLGNDLQFERNANSKLKDMFKIKKDENDLIKNKLVALRNIYEESENKIEVLKKSIEIREKDKLVEEKSFKELELESNRLNCDREKMIKTGDQQRDQILQLQQLIVSKDQEYKNALVGMVSINSKEVKDIIEAEVSKCEAKCSILNKQNIQQLKETKSNYHKLEDEFRLALQIEAKRHNELYALHETNVDELNKLRFAFEEVSQKEAKSKSLLSEFTSLVKEQKTRIIEMNKSKCDLQLQFKERLSGLETQVSTLRKVESKHNNILQDKERMAAHIHAQESVIQGLRSERKLWGKELAEQGASLAQEKGRNDWKLESQQNEITKLHKELDESHDSIKIKAKMIEDLSETIRSLKEENTKASLQNKKIVDDTLIAKNILQSELDNVKEHNDELLESVNILTNRKEELKCELSAVEECIAQSEHREKQFKSEWEERSKLIDQFDEKVRKMKDTFDEKEFKLINERNIEVDRANVAEEKLTELENKCQSKLAAIKHDFNLECRKIIVSKDNEIQKAKDQVIKVEEEMTILLTETKCQKDNWEKRFSTLSNAFSDLKQDFS